MKNTERIIFFSLVLLMGMSLACGEGEELSDAFGNFEADEIILSSEVGGKLILLPAEEGQEVDSGGLVALVDTMQHYLKWRQLKAQKQALSSRIRNLDSQVRIQEEQKKPLVAERERLIRLKEKGAATQRQLDDIKGKIAVVESTIASIKTQDPGVFSELEAMDFQMEQLQDLMQKCRIRSPQSATILEKYSEAGEIVQPGKGIVKLARIDHLFLKAYVSGKQLSQIKLGQEVEVRFDGEGGAIQNLKGMVRWISQEAEFTPKIIQTREERVNLVYAIRVEVANEGKLKIGMPGEVRFIPSKEQ